MNAHEVDRAAVKVAAEAIEDAAMRLIGRDLGTIYRDEIVTAGLTAAYPAIREGIAAELLAEAAASWVCGRCGQAPETHSRTDSTCIYDPVLRYQRLAVVTPRKNTLTDRVSSALSTGKEATKHE